MKIGTMALIGSAVAVVALSGVAVVALEDMGICLQEEPSIRVSDPLADHLGAQASLQRAGR